MIRKTPLLKSGGTGVSPVSNRIRTAARCKRVLECPAAWCSKSPSPIPVPCVHERGGRCLRVGRATSGTSLSIHIFTGGFPSPAFARIFAACFASTQSTWPSPNKTSIPSPPWLDSGSYITTAFVATAEAVHPRFDIDIRKIPARGDIVCNRLGGGTACRFVV